ncbi:MAG: hypothetical protein ACLFTR_03000 [Candidatus Woesearchaeota archaeon]
MARKTVSKSVKKSWYKIVAPKVLNDVEVGETQAISPDAIVGRTIKSSLMSLNRSFRKQNVTVTLKVKEVKEKTGICDIQSYVMNPSGVKRLVKRRRDKIDDSFVCKTKDGKLVRVKPMILTRSNTSNPTLSAMRHVMRYAFMSKILNLSYGQFIEEVLNDKIVKNVKKLVSYIYPVRMVSVRAFKLEENPKVKSTRLTVTDKKYYDHAATKLEEKKSSPKPLSTASEGSAEPTVVAESN